MNRAYLVMVNNTVWDKKNTLHFAKKIAAELNEKFEAMGSKQRAVVAYDLTGGQS